MIPLLEHPDLIEVQKRSYDNFLQSKKVEDIDIATIFTPSELKKKLNDSNFKIIDTGLDHGSVTIVTKEKKFELTTLRKDIKTDGRHAVVQTIDDWKEDSKRRDFTINAIYLSKKGKIFFSNLNIHKFCYLIRKKTYLYKH